MRDHTDEGSNYADTAMLALMAIFVVVSSAFGDYVLVQMVGIVLGFVLLVLTWWLKMNFWFYAGVLVYMFILPVILSTIFLSQKKNTQLNIKM